MAESLGEELSMNGYPGRGLVVAATAEDGLCIVYFVTGRSPASQDRVLVRDGNSVYARPQRTEGRDPLRHYRAVTIGPDWCVVGNGDQVDTITTNLQTMTPAEAMQGINYEPDPPLRTPRISVVSSRRPGALVMSGARASVLDPAASHLTCVTVGDLTAGCAILTTTYLSKGTQVTATDHAPCEVSVSAGTATGLLSDVWDALPVDLRVTAAVVQPHAADPLATEPIS